MKIAELFFIGGGEGGGWPLHWTIGGTSTPGKIKGTFYPLNFDFQKKMKESFHAELFYSR